MKKILVKSVLCAALALSLFGCNNDNNSNNSADVPNPAKVDLELQLLHFSDMDGSDVVAMKNVENFSALVEHFKKDKPNNTLLLSSGDNFIPGSRVAAADNEAFKSIPEVGTPGRARADIAFLNAMGVQASVVGNHDLDEGPGGLVEAIKPEDKFVGAKFPYLSANLDFSTEKDIKDLEKASGQDLSTLPAGSVSGYGTLMVNGQKIGIIGASTPTLPQITSTGKIGVKPASENIDELAKTIQESVDKLIADTGVNKVILLAHMQAIHIEKDLAAKLKNVDIIVAGGSNTLLADANDTLQAGDSVEGEYPYQTKSAIQEPILVVNTDGDYKYLGRLVVGFDKEGRIIPSTLNDKVNGAYASTDAVVNSVNGIKNTAVTTINQKLIETLNVLDGDIHGKSAVYLNGLRKSVRSEETNLGNLTADANLWYAQQYDSSVAISIKNGGGIRDVIGSAIVPPGATTGELQTSITAANPSAGKKAGDISQLDISNSLRFNNKLVVGDITAKELVSILEHGVAKWEYGKGQFPQVSGLRFSFNPDKPARQASGTTVTQKGERVRNLVLVNASGAIIDTIVRDGQLQGDANRKIRMVTLAYLASKRANGVGGDGYPFDFPLENRIDVAEQAIKGVNNATFSIAGGEQDALAEYLHSKFAQTGFAMADTEAKSDMRIQNLKLRKDTIFK